jgi:hypothetical protein
MVRMLLSEPSQWKKMTDEVLRKKEILMDKVKQLQAQCDDYKQGRTPTKTKLSTSFVILVLRDMLPLLPTPSFSMTINDAFPCS